MLSRTSGSLCRNMKGNSIEAKLNYSANIKVSTMKETRSTTNADSNSDEERKEDGYEDEQGMEWTLFKTIFKKYKKRRPPADLSEVIDAKINCDTKGVYVEQVDCMRNINEEEINQLGLKPIKEWKKTMFKGRDGLFILSNILRDDAHELWIKRAFQYALPPNTTNMTIHGDSPTSDALSVGTRLRWCTLGVQYDWSTKEYPQQGRSIPAELSNMGKVVCDVLGLQEMKPDAAIVNFYPPKTSLSPHVDKSERSSAALVSFSLGQSAVYLSGGLSLDDDVIPIWLHGGDILVMYGEQRLVYHAVPCIRTTRQYNILDKDKRLKDFADSSRINITIRQVNPHL